MTLVLQEPLVLQVQMVQLALRVQQVPQVRQVLSLVPLEQWDQQALQVQLVILERLAQRVRLQGLPAL